ncbi:hypothetical protein ACJX0J_016555, partial [Zea mays]
KTIEYTTFFLFSFMQGNTGLFQYTVTACVRFFMYNFHKNSIENLHELVQNTRKTFLKFKYVFIIILGT